jgi:hypothetical protein
MTVTPYHNKMVGVCRHYHFSNREQCCQLFVTVSDADPAAICFSFGTA